MHMNTKQRKPSGPVHRRKGQSIVEFALGSILLVMLLATAIDLGRAFFTWQVVHQMAAEAAAYVARYPNNDCVRLNNCTSDTTPPPAHPDEDTYQGRAWNVGMSAGRIFDPGNVNSTSGITVSVPPASRCLGTTFTVNVNYSMSDLFIPAFFGVQRLNLGAEETSAFLTNNTGCPTQ
jgi:hypothetical protein